MKFPGIWGGRAEAIGNLKPISSQHLTVHKEWKFCTILNVVARAQSFTSLMAESDLHQDTPEFCTFFNFFAHFCPFCLSSTFLPDRTSHVCGVDVCVRRRERAGKAKQNEHPHRIHVRGMLCSVTCTTVSTYTVHTLKYVVPTVTSNQVPIMSYFSQFYSSDNKILISPTNRLLVFREA